MIDKLVAIYFSKFCSKYIKICLATFITEVLYAIEAHWEPLFLDFLVKTDSHIPTMSLFSTRKRTNVFGPQEILQITSPSCVGRGLWGSKSLPPPSEMEIFLVEK